MITWDVQTIAGVKSVCVWGGDQVWMDGPMEKWESAENKYPSEQR